MLTKDQFKSRAGLMIEQQSKLSLTKLCMDERTGKVVDSSKSNFIQYRGLKECFDFVCQNSDRFNVNESSEKLWKYIKGLKPYNKPNK